MEIIPANNRCCALTGGFRLGIASELGGVMKAGGT